MKLAIAKKALDLLSDERVRTFVLSIIIGSILMLLLPLLLIISISNVESNYSQEIAKIVFDGGPIPTELPNEHIEWIEEMIDHFELLDIEMEEQSEELDAIKIKSFFYVLYFGEPDLEFEEMYYKDFIEMFKDEKDDKEVIKKLEDLTELEFSKEMEVEQKELYLFIKYGYTAISDFSGIPTEAFDDETFAKLMSEATKYIGMPYVWGGSSPSTSFDCSGFICWIYTQSGVYNLPRTTAQGIYNQCMPVAKEDIRPGDLVFFTGTYITSSPVTHLGIYVGDNQMLHCGDPIGYVSLSNSYWKKHFYGYGRLEGWDE